MRQVLVNLINNALEAVREVAEPQIVLSLGRKMEQADKKIVITVLDNGSGIPAAKRSQVFEPYFTTRKDGTGLGLAIVNRIVNEHGGQIRVLDGTKTGTKFEIQLPEVT